MSKGFDSTQLQVFNGISTMLSLCSRLEEIYGELMFVNNGIVVNTEISTINITLEIDTRSNLPYIQLEALSLNGFMDNPVVYRQTIEFVVITHGINIVDSIIIKSIENINEQIEDYEAIMADEMLDESDED